MKGDVAVCGNTLMKGGEREEVKRYARTALTTVSIPCRAEAKGQKTGNAVIARRKTVGNSWLYLNHGLYKLKRKMERR